MLTIKIKYTINDTDKLLLNDYIKQYNHVYRVAFNNLLSHKKNKLSELTNLNNIDLLYSWFISSANYESKFLYNLIGDKKVIFSGRKNFIKRCLNKISYDIKLLIRCIKGTKINISVFDENDEYKTHNVYFSYE